MNAISRSAMAVAAMAFATQAAAQIIFYEREGFQGRTFTTEEQVRNLERFGFNDRASSVEVLADRWEVCDDAGFRGRCIVLRPGRYPSLAAMGMDNRISSVRDVSPNARFEDKLYAPAPVAGPDYRDGRDYRRRNGERVYEANVTSVRAVVGTAEQRCWVEHGQAQPRSGTNVPGTIAGALIGGILGHQIGRGTGQDIATVGGAVAGAVVGGRIGSGQQAQAQDVQRCDTVPSQAPTYWDVTYIFRGQEHRVQLTTQPGPTITVNDQGEPRA
jgi:uncharacterized protein YcfJ